MPHFPFAVYIVSLFGVLIVAWGVYIAVFMPVYSNGRQHDDDVDANGLVGSILFVIGCAAIGITLAVQFSLDSGRYTSAAHSAAHRWEQQTHNVVIQIDARAGTFSYVPIGKAQICTNGSLKLSDNSYQLEPQTAICRESS